MEDNVMPERETHVASTSDTLLRAESLEDTVANDVSPALPPLVAHLDRLRAASRPLDVCIADLLDAAREERADGE